MEQDLSGAFAVRACLAVLPTPHSREWREGIWLRATDKSWKGLTDLPRRLQKMADEIGSLNTNFFCIPDGCANQTLVSFYRLPTVLRSYATALNHRTTIISKAIDPPSHSRRLVELSNFTKLVTGRYRDREVAELLNAAAITIGYENARGFDALHLMQARHRYRGPHEGLLPPR